MSKAEGKKRKKKTSERQRDLIITWLEVPKNFNLITGKAAAGSVVAGTKLKKTDAYQLLAEYVNEHEKLTGIFMGHEFGEITIFCPAHKLQKCKKAIRRCHGGKILRYRRRNERRLKQRKKAVNDVPPILCYG